MSNELSNGKVMDTIGGDFLDLVVNAAKETGVELATDASEIAAYAADRSRHLSSIVGQEGFREALIAERDNVALKAGIAAVDAAEAADRRILGVLEGGLSLGARALAGIGGVGGLLS